ncbi:toll/interleukin-1 receptor domain-containing protein [Gordonia paraffinivorans]|uniref:toll/interleukin-1 receptor domain-containing protein n=1 Tax=Gordonia paraffinivorans TaxID=175628 RepID=UPI001447CB10|nr:TIR domain-containing protein [Gordonia paraffinivorans]
MKLSAATGFWSYVHKDDENAQGHIRDLAGQVKGAFQLLTGEEISIFFDRDDLKWGSAWDERIKDSIAGTTFFIPIVTPSYLNSAACRGEFLQFWRKVKDTPLRELLLPILYVETSLPEDSEDEIIQAIRATQYVNWSEIRLEDERGPVYKKAIRDLGLRLKEISESVADAPEQERSAEDVDGTDDSPGLFEAIAHSEEIMETLDPVIEEMQSSFVEVSETLTQGFDNVPKTSKFAKKVVYMRGIARDMAKPAQVFADRSKEFKDAISGIQDAVISATDFATAQRDIDGSDELIGQALEAADSFDQAKVDIEATFGSYKEVQEVFRQMTRMSREFKGPAKALEQGLRNIFDAAALLNGIAEEIRSRIEPNE